MKRDIHPAKHVEGTLSVPGDKSIAQRAILFSALCSGPVTITNFPGSGDCLSALKVIQQFGVSVSRDGNSLVLTPPSALSLAPDTILDCGNSATTARLLTGYLAGSPHSAIVAGDDSLTARPMKRIVDPLTAMGAEIISDEGALPLTVHGKRLLPFEYTLPVASAQVKSALLMAGAASGCTVEIREPVVTRDHSEILLNHLGATVEITDIKPVIMEDPNDPRKRSRIMPEDFKRRIVYSPRTAPQGGTVDLPGDMSTAAFFLALGAISGNAITVQNVGLNPTRTGFLEYLRAIGCDAVISDKNELSGELRGTVTVSGRPSKIRRIAGQNVVELIDEIPILAVIAAFSEGTTVIRDAGELRLKESDRLAAMAENLSRMGVSVGLLEDGLAIEGRKEMSGTDFVTFGDHRIAMACAIAAKFLIGPSTLDNDTCVAVSCPQFFDLLNLVTP